MTTADLFHDQSVPISRPAIAALVRPRRAAAVARPRIRVMVAMAGFGAVYALIIVKLVMLGISGDDRAAALERAKTQISTPRPDLIDRNGEVLASDIKTSSLYAEPKLILDVDEAMDALSSVLPELREPSTRTKLASRAGFVWLKREITQEQRARIYRLGIPGIGFFEENKRFYPGNGMVSHVVGAVNVDNQGISGLERYLDTKTGLVELQKLNIVGGEHSLEPEKLSIDLRVQHVVRDEVADAKEKYHAIAGMGIVLDVHTMEVLSMVSLPDYDPNNPREALEKDKMNRVTAGVYEMGSVFKTFNSAMALDSGKIKLEDTFDARGALAIGNKRINDFHGTNRILTVSEVFTHSSNIGSARMALKVGAEAQRAFFEKMGFLKKLDTDLPEVAMPLYPKRLSDISTATMAFGHGISVTPMHTAVAAAALMNGGMMMNPTFLARTREEAEKVAWRVVKPETSDKLRYLFRLNVEKGSGRRAEVVGYRVGGKTGTAEKIENGHYSAHKRFNSFLAAFPMDNPQYLVLVVLDEPKAEKDEGAATASLNAAPAVSNIIRRIAPMLGVMPKFDVPPAAVAAN